MQDRIKALQELIRLPQQNPQAVGIAIAIAVLLGIVMVLLLIALALPGKRRAAQQAPEDITVELDFISRLFTRRDLARRWESILLTVSIVVIGFTAAAVLWYRSTSTDSYCAQTCHAMVEPAESWQLSAHREVQCVRCHEGPAWTSLPQALVSRSRSLVYELTETSATPHPVAEETCLQCHEGLLVQEIVGRNGSIFTHEMVISDDRTCKTCHGEQGHVAP